jgi:hypothetical protein
LGFEIELLVLMELQNKSGRILSLLLSVIPNVLQFGKELLVKALNQLSSIITTPELFRIMFNPSAIKEFSLLPDEQFLNEAINNYCSSLPTDLEDRHCCLIAIINCLFCNELAERQSFYTATRLVDCGVTTSTHFPF